MGKIGIIILIIIFGLFFNTLFISAKTVPINNQSACEIANAEWQYISPENAESRYECVCNEYVNGKQIKVWNGTSCIIITDEVVCKNTGGNWELNMCDCQNGEWIISVGCQILEHETPLTWIIPTILIVAIILIILLIIILKRKK
ncbi:MAG: hypothetical protein WC584_04080 [Candidatus Pacearchaeota archaeon]